MREETVISESETSARPTITIVCVGKTFLRGGKVECIFNEVLPDGMVGAERIYSEKDLKHVRVGAVYQVEVDFQNQRSIYPSTIRWLRLRNDTEAAAAWQLAADAFDTAATARRQEKKETNRELVLELLEPIRKQYWKTNAARRIAMEVRLLAYLRRVPLAEE